MANVVKVQCTQSNVAMWRCSFRPYSTQRARLIHESSTKQLSTTCALLTWSRSGCHLLADSLPIADSLPRRAGVLLTMHINGAATQGL